MCSAILFDLLPFDLRISDNLRREDVKVDKQLVGRCCRSGGQVQLNLFCLALALYFLLDWNSSLLTSHSRLIRTSFLLNLLAGLEMAI